MPDHVHGLFGVVGEALAPPGVSTSAATDAGQDLGSSAFEIMRVFKSLSARKVNQELGTHGRGLWQRGFHEHVVRAGEELGNIRRYMLENPMRWETERGKAVKTTESL